MKFYLRFSFLLAGLIPIVPVRADYASTVAGFNPLAWWQFNETNPSPPLNLTSNWASSGAALNGNVVLDVGKGQPGVVGNAARFVNSGNVLGYCGSKIDVPFSAALNPSAPFSVEFWAKPNSLGANADGFCPLSSHNPHFTAFNRSGWLLYVNNAGTWQFRIGGETGYLAVLAASGGAAATNVWQHIVATYDGLALRLYVNGTNVGTATLSASVNGAYRPNTQAPLRFGGTSFSGNLSDSPAVVSATGVSGNRGFDGWLDEVAIYGGVLSEADIAGHFAAATTNNAGYSAQILAANPVGYWPLNEPVAVTPNPSALPTATNSGSTGPVANGTNVWGVLMAQPGTSYPGFGASNRAAYFNGTSGYLSIGNPSPLNVGGQITLMAWIKPAVKDFYRYILAHGWDGAKGETFLRISRGSGGSGYGDGNYYEVGVTDGSSYYDTATFPIPAADIGNWVFLAGTYDGTNWNLYRNGKLVASQPATHGARVTTSRWSVGARSDPSAASGTYFGGFIDEPAIFGTALSAANIATIYNSAQLAPVIHAMPQSQLAYEGWPVTFAVSAAGNVPLTYQWKKDGNAIGGATNDSYTIAVASPGDAGAYTVAITNALGQTSSVPATLTVEPPPPVPDADMQLTGSPDFTWYAGCFGTATGNLMGYWDRRGFPDFYTGPTAGGVAPLNNCGNNFGIRSLWATKAGLDGRPANQPGHIDDYWLSYAFNIATCGTSDSYSYESTLADPYMLSNRTEHVADCIGDFTGLSQKRWTNMNNECDGNIDAYSFVFWDTNGTKRINYLPPPQGTNPVRDIPSGLRAWAQWRGYDAEVFSQLVEFNPECPPGTGFTFADLRRELDAGYPVLAFLQDYSAKSRSLGGMSKANPVIHGMVIYGYMAYAAFGTNVYCRTSWGSGDDLAFNWSASPWVAGTLSLPLRGVIGFRPKPRIRGITVTGGNVTLSWDGPSSHRYDVNSMSTTPLNWYQVERSLGLSPSDFQPIGSATTELFTTVPGDGANAVFYRIRQMSP